MPVLQRLTFLILSFHNSRIIWVIFGVFSSHGRSRGEAGADQNANPVNEPSLCEWDRSQAKFQNLYYTPYCWQDQEGAWSWKHMEYKLRATIRENKSFL